MRLQEFKSYMATRVQPKSKSKEMAGSEAWEVMTNEDLAKLAEQIEDELESKGKKSEVIDGDVYEGDDEEDGDLQRITEKDLAKALSLLSDASSLMASLADKDSTPKLTQRDRDDLEQVSGEIDEFIDGFDEDWWQEEVKGKV